VIDDTAHHQAPLGEAQSSRRGVERLVRVRVVALRRCWGLGAGDVAQRLGIAPRTVRAWSARWRHARLAALSRGRPIRPVDAAVRDEVAEVLSTHGLAVGVPSLKGLFRSVPRTLLRDWRAQSRTAALRAAPPASRLTWLVAGSVWSTDFTAPPGLVDGAYAKVLVVRDLASRCNLLALPVCAESARVVAGALAMLFMQHGPPLVLKSDNGSPFIAAAAAGLLARQGVTHLRSPALTPSYNGSVESAGGWLKARAVQMALCSQDDDRPDEDSGRPLQDQLATHQPCSARPPLLSSDHLEASRLCGNALARPWGVNGPTPQERWEQRSILTAAARAEFLGRVVLNRAAIEPNVIEHGRGSATQLSAGQRSSVDRVAIRRALVELGYLLVRSSSLLSTDSDLKNGKD
jgi:transposase InsO family protein